MYCVKCSHPVEPGAAFCTECGAPVERVEPVESSVGERIHARPWMIPAAIAASFGVAFGLAFGVWWWWSQPPAIPPKADPVQIAGKGAATEGKAAESKKDEPPPETAEAKAARFVKQLEEGGPPERARAVEELGLLGDAATVAVPKLVPLLIDPNEAMRDRVAKALTSINAGWKSSDEFKALLASLMRPLQGDDWAGRARAVERLDFLGDAAAAAFSNLVPLAVDPDEELRARVVKMLGSMNPEWKSSDEFKALLKGLEGRIAQPPMGRDVLDTLAILGPDARPLVPKLVAAVNWSDFNDAATTTLDKLDPDWRGSDVAKETIGHALPLYETTLVEWREGPSAIHRLGLMGPPAGGLTPALVEVLFKDDPEVHLEVIQTLDRVRPDWRALPETAAIAKRKLKNLSHADPTAAGGGFTRGPRLVYNLSAIDALGEIGPPAMPFISELKRIEKESRRSGSFDSELAYTLGEAIRRIETGGPRSLD